MNNIQPKNNLTFTVGISTRCGGQGLIPAAKSILESEGVPKFRFIVVADTIPLDKKVAQQLTDWGIEIVENHGASSLPAKLKQKLDMCQTDIIIFTHDDVKFKPDTLKQILNVFQSRQEVTFVVTRVVPMNYETLLEKVLNTSVNIIYDIVENWRGGDNYVAANGRCMCFRTAHLRKMRIPETATCIDAYLYFENKFKGGSFAYAGKAHVFNKNPRYLAEYLRQSRRFQFSQKEMSLAFGTDLSSEYKIPKDLVVKVFFKEFIKHPWLTFLYVCLLVYRTIFKGRYSKEVNPLWKVDQSTKKI